MNRQLNLWEIFDHIRKHVVKFTILKGKEHYFLQSCDSGLRVLCTISLVLLQFSEVPDGLVSQTLWIRSEICFFVETSLKSILERTDDPCHVTDGFVVSTVQKWVWFGWWGNWLLCTVSAICSGVSRLGCVCGISFSGICSCNHNFVCLKLIFQSESMWRTITFALNYIV